MEVDVKMHLSWQNVDLVHKCLADGKLVAVEPFFQIIEVLHHFLQADLAHLDCLGALKFGVELLSLSLYLFKVYEYLI